jgi:hypothetical protein
MDAFFQWLTSNPIAETVLVTVLGVFILAITFIFLVAFLQGREIFFYPPKIGELPKTKFPENYIRNRNPKATEFPQGMEQNHTSRNLEGIWYSSYSPSDSIKNHDHVLKLQQFGNQITAASLEGSPSSHGFRLKGTVRFDIYFSGYWESAESGSIHHGVFQFIIDRKGRNMAGKWLGLKGTDSINSGDWVLNRKE